MIFPKSLFHLVLGPKFVIGRNSAKAGIRNVFELRMTYYMALDAITMKIGKVTEKNLS